MNKEENDRDERQKRARREQLADFLERTCLKLASTQNYLRHGGNYNLGFNILGLICEAYRSFASDGGWQISRGTEVMDFVCRGKRHDQFLPQAVVEFFGFRDSTGSFEAGELPQEVKNLMGKPRNGPYSLLEAGKDHSKKRGKEIASQIIRTSPPSLLESYEPGPDVARKETPSSTFDIRPKTVELPPAPENLNIQRREAGNEADD